ncbi:Uncharacterised protein [Burkholderia pseudomallei]|nr:Uncharacterised protein [Burkholderia pseudomallei]CAJ8167455.1 Uncharacterised protein [Burkholderia pseudomallei]
MSIRSNNNTKDHLREQGSALSLVVEPPAPVILGPLRFWTAHPEKKCLVDLEVFASGQQASRGSKWKGPFRGRPELIHELFPALVDHLSPLAEKSVAQHLNALRAWWRLFDAVENAMPEASIVSSTVDLNELHGQRARDDGMGRLPFGHFLSIANKTRAGLGVRQLYWQRPEHPDPSRHLPPQWQTDLLRHDLKHRWFAALDRWDLTTELLRTGVPVASHVEQPTAYIEQNRLLEGYRRFDEFVKRTKAARPESVEELFGDDSKDDFYSKHNLTLAEILRGRYPDGDDIRAAFHLCLATTGWNPAVFLDLNAQEPFIEPHPKDSTRYILRGYKDKARGSEQVYEGLFKTRGGAGFVLQKLLAQTAPLRLQLQRELVSCQEEQARADSLELQSRIANLEEGLRSVWLFTNRYGIHWLNGGNYEGKEFLPNVIKSLNSGQAADRQIASVTATDLRDAFAARVYHASGGSILAVMRALNHKRLSSTRAYLDNTLLQEEHRKLYGTFSNALWQEIQVHRRVDPTILAMWSRYGNVTEDNRQRLATYRNLLRSRIGVGCKDPHNPPKHIAPDFEPDGEAMCSVHRCLLCLEHAVLFPDSLPGLCKRLAELRHLRENMSVTAYEQSSFGEEMKNVELALLGFDRQLADVMVTEWEVRIASGAHRVMEFDGAEA